MTTASPEDLPDDKCEHCGTNCAGKQLSQAIIRTTTDDEDELYVNVADLERLMDILIEYQIDASASSMARLDEDSNEFAVASLRAEAGCGMSNNLAANTLHLIRRRGETGMTADNLPDSVPAEWMPET